MIFGKPLLGKLLAGEKTETRRLVQPAHQRDHYRRGMVRAVQSSRGKVAIAQIRLVQVRREPLGQLDDQAVIAEGFASRVAFARYWMAMHDPMPSMRRAVARDPGDVSGLPDDRVLEYFADRHADRHVWVLRFRLVTEQPPLLLAQRGGGGGVSHPFRSARELGDVARANAAGREYDPWPQREVDDEHAAAAEARGYTTSVARAMKDEPESVGDVGRLPASLEARQRWQLEQLEVAAELRALPVDERIANARRLAAAGHVNVTSDIRVVERLSWSGDEERAARHLDALEGRLLSAEARVLYPDRAALEDQDRAA